MRKYHQKIILISTGLLILSLVFSGCGAAPQAETPDTQPTEPTRVEEAAPSPEPTDPPAPTPTQAPSHLPETTPTAEPAIELIDGLGNPVVLEAPAQRIVSLAPSNTEILFAIGAGDQVVGRDTFSDYPAETSAITDIGGGWGEIDLETTVALEPDLILASELNAPEQAESLRDLGLTVYYLDNPIDLPGMFDNLRIVARLTGRDTETEELIAGLEARVAAVTEQIETISDRPLVFYELDGTDPNAPWTSGPGTFVDTLLMMAGGENMGRDLEGAWVQISLEELIVQDPDVILLGDAVWGGVTPESVSARPGWEGLSAVENGRVLPFDDNLVSRPGPRMVTGLEELARLLHPDQF